MTAQSLDVAINQFNFEEMIKSYMDNPIEFVPNIDMSYPISWFREPFSLPEAMLCRLYELPNCIAFKVEWAPIAHHILTTGKSINWAHILSGVLKEAIEKYQKKPTSRKP